GASARSFPWSGECAFVGVRAWKGDFSFWVLLAEICGFLDWLCRSKRTQLSAERGVRLYWVARVKWGFFVLGFACGEICGFLDWLYRSKRTQLSVEWGVRLCGGARVER
ncbi:hypothetical protein TresaDRAFT_1940, partial [Treponema saccharophilum DSM 2985]